ncbi:MAG: response regulator [Lachnospiraceae bacterium]|nr:response regulator [Lachnospiraceae bacterium]
MNNSGVKVAVIAYQFSVVVKSMEKGLRDMNFEVTLMDDSADKIRAALKELDVFILYLPDSILDSSDRIRKLLLISDCFKDNERNLILIGAANKRLDIEKTVPGLKEAPWLDRPVDMHKLIKEIEIEAENARDTRSKKKILLIDDDPFFARMVSEWMKDDFETEMVTGGMQGISYIANNKVDLILLDYEMPVVDGPKILEMLRELPETSSIPVIFLTGVGTKESIARVMALRPQGYILKTATREELIASIKGFFEKQRYR